jgi:hypothetical protein
MVNFHQHIFLHSVERVIDATLRALAQLHHKTGNVDRQSGVINFETGITLLSFGQKWSIVITKTDPNGSLVNFRNQLKWGLFDWGEASRLRMRLIELIDQNLSAAG